MNKILYLCCAGSILLFSIIVVNIAPYINGIIDNSEDWSTDSCKHYSDQYKSDKDKDAAYFGSQDAKDETLDQDKKDKNRCERKQAMAGLEYTALNINLVFGFICTLLGFLYFFNIGEIGKITSFAGIGTGIVAFVLTFVYVIESGLVFNDRDETPYLKLDSDGAILEWDNNKNSYVCLFYDKDNKDSVHLKYSDYNNKYLGYTKEVNFKDEEKNYEFNNIDFTGDLSNNEGCNINYLGEIQPGLEEQGFYNYCQALQEGTATLPKISYNDDSANLKECKKIFYVEDEYDYEYKILYDRWLTTIIFSCVIALLDIGLAIFGFLLMSNSNKGGI